MNDPIVTYADLPVLRAMLQGGFADGWREVVDRLIAAAEADAPPLPEGWVLLVGDDGGLYPYWHEDNRLSSGKGKAAYKIEATAASMRNRLTPLRPTITEAEFYAAVKAHDSIRIASAEDCIRNAFAAAGVVIEP